MNLSFSKTGEASLVKWNYLGPHIVDNILKHKIHTEDDTYLLIDNILVSSIITPGICTIPVTVEQFVTKLPKLTRQQIEQISNPEILDDDQHEFMGLHCKMNHLPFPAMIHLAEYNRIKKKFTWLKHQLPICMPCIFGTSHRKPWRTKGSHGSICRESNDAPWKCVSMDQMVITNPCMDWVKLAIATFKFWE